MPTITLILMTASAAAPLKKETCNYFKFVGDDEGYFLLAAGVPFDVSKPIVYLTSTVNKGYTTSNAYLVYPAYQCEIICPPLPACRPHRFISWVCWMAPPSRQPRIT